MAPHPRMLFPYPSNATSCSFDCSDACSFYGLCNPFLYSPPPPPPPPPQQNPTSPIRLHHSSRLSLALVASASALAAASLLLLLSCLLSLHLRRRRSASSAGAAAADSEAGADADSEAGGFVDEDGGVHHHVWYIRTVGLDEPTIGAIAVWVYRSGDGGVLVGGGGAGCAVCLAEFRDGELLRLLPKCGHAFHVACIDAWLRGHVNCPLCRAPIMAPTPAPAPAPNPGLALPSSSPLLSPSSSPSLSPSSSSSSSSSSSDATISDRDASDSGDQVEVRGIEEGTDAGDVEIGGGNSIEVDSTIELSSSSSTRVLSNSQDKV